MKFGETDPSTPEQRGKIQRTRKNDGAQLQDIRNAKDPKSQSIDSLEPPIFFHEPIVPFYLLVIV